MFEDGDHLAIVLRKESGRWTLTDEGHTYMHLTYDLEEKDLLRGTRQKIIRNAPAAFSVDDRDGELVLPIDDERYGDALFSFVEALLSDARNRRTERGLLAAAPFGACRPHGSPDFRSCRARSSRIPGST